MLLAGLLAVISLFVRFLGAREEERQQIKWFASASVLTFTWILLFEGLPGSPDGLFEVLVAASSPLIVPSTPIATGMPSSATGATI
jgi:RsiW-degrading membrane proteinase PrsW (M82 family)